MPAKNVAHRRPAEFFNSNHAKWLVGVLTVLIDVVGKYNMLGMILGQARSEVSSLLRSESAREDSNEASAA